MASRPKRTKIGVKHLNWLWSGAAPIAHSGRCEIIIGDPPGIYKKYARTPRV